MYFLTWQHAGAFPSETERLWTTVAANKRNIIPILDFLIARGLQEAAEPHLQACNFSFFLALFCLYNFSHLLGSQQSYHTLHRKGTAAPAGAATIPRPCVFCAS